MSQIEKSQPRQTKTLIETMQEIRQNIRNEELQKKILEQKLDQQYRTSTYNQAMTASMLNNSLRYNPDGWKQDLQAKDLVTPGQLAQSQAQQQRNIEELEQSQAFTQHTLEQLVNHINKHLQKLCDAVIILQRDVEKMKAHVYRKQSAKYCCCCCEEEGEEDEEYETAPCQRRSQNPYQYEYELANGEDEEEEEYECYCKHKM